MHLRFPCNGNVSKADDVCFNLFYDLHRSVCSRLDVGTVRIVADVNDLVRRATASLGLDEWIALSFRRPTRIRRDLVGLVGLNWSIHAGSSVAG